MISLYIDFDGVLVDTIKETYKMMGENDINLNDTDKVIKFYKELDWDKLLLNTKEINNSFKNIKKLQNSFIYNPCILTTVNSLNEINAKVSFIRSKNKDINIICVPKGIDKCKMVNSKNAILVDDYGGNLEPWIESGGFGIKFSNEESHKYITIYSLNELLNKNVLKSLQKYNLINNLEINDDICILKL